jgi:hypothetical protein
VYLLLIKWGEGVHGGVRLKCGSGTERMRNGTDAERMRLKCGTDMGLKCGTERIWG